jgi:xylan 1,4-beta-xylosidase
MRRLSLLLLFTFSAHAQETITIDGSAAVHPFPHFWEQMFGSGRANLSLRDSYRQDLRAVRDITGFQYIRFHGIFDDENGVYDEDAQGKPVYNFSWTKPLRGRR